MSNSKLSMPEAICIILTVFVAHSFISLPRNLLISSKSAIIINLVYVSAIACLLTFLLFKLFSGFGSSDIIDISEYLGGIKFKRIIGFIFISYLSFSSAILLRSFSECLKVVFFPTTNILFIILAFIITIILSNKYNFSSTGKISLLILPIVVFTIIFTFFANFNNFDINNIFPILGDGAFNTFITGLENLSAFGGIAVLYFIPPLLKEPRNFKKIAMYSIGISSGYLILCVSTLLLILPFLQDVDTLMPFYYAAKHIELRRLFSKIGIYISFCLDYVCCFLFKYLC